MEYPATNRGRVTPMNSNITPPRALNKTGKRSRWVLNIWRFILAGVMAFLASGCAVSNSIGNVIFVPPGDPEHAKLKVWVEAYESLPPFIYWRPEWLPKRAILEVYIVDYKRGKLILNYSGKLKATPHNLEPTSKLLGDTLTVAVKDRSTHESRLVEFRRGADGEFRVVGEQGEFRR